MGSSADSCKVPTDPGIVRIGPMKEWLDEFLSDFHRGYLKEPGFKKARRTFSRDMGDYWERFNFQGSMSNYPDHESWRFYLNVGGVQRLGATKILVIVSAHPLV
jgi:hypothetical protein